MPTLLRRIVRIMAIPLHIIGIMAIAMRAVLIMDTLVLRTAAGPEVLPMVARLALHVPALVLLLLIEAGAAVVVPRSAVGTSLFGHAHGRRTGRAVNNSTLGHAHGRRLGTVEPSTPGRLSCISGAWAGVRGAGHVHPHVGWWVGGGGAVGAVIGF